jgi:MoxR-like ATPase
VVDIDDVVGAQRSVDGVFLADPIARWIVDVLAATRTHPQVRLGASTRGGVALVALARARAAMAGRHYVVPDDVAALAVPALAHRVIVANAAGSVDAGREVVAECLNRVPAPTA